MRILDNLNISYSVLEYDISDDHNEDIARFIAHSLNIQEHLFYKTIVLEDSDKNHFVFCLPAGFSINMKKVKSITKSSSIDLLKTDKLLALTGYIRGGVSPLGMKRHFPTFIEELSQLEEFIYISGGLRGIALKLRSTDLVAACNGMFESFT